MRASRPRRSLFSFIFGRCCGDVLRVVIAFVDENRLRFAGLRQNGRQPRSKLRGVCRFIADMHADNHTTLADIDRDLRVVTLQEPSASTGTQTATLRFSQARSRGKVGALPMLATSLIGGL